MWLIDNDNRSRGLDKLDRLAARQFVTLLVDDIALLLSFSAGKILAEGVDVDDEDLEGVAGGELAQAVDLAGIIDKMLEG